MKLDFAHILVVLLLVAVCVVLLAGVGLMARGGEVNKKYGNRLMVLRVALQGAVILLLGVMFLFGKR